MSAVGTQFSVIALILIACDVRQGEWVPLDAIVARVGGHPDRVKAECDLLVEQGQLQHATRSGMPLYGVGTEGVRP